MEAPRAVYIAFDVFPRSKGSSTHIASMVKALSAEYAPVLLICLGYGDMPSRQVEGDVHIHRFKVYHPNMLRRAVEFSDFVVGILENAGNSIELVVFRDPWGGSPALQMGLDCGFLFEVNALPTWELPYTYPKIRDNHALMAKLEDMERLCLHACDHILTVSPVTRRALVGWGVKGGKISVIPNAASQAFFCGKPDDCPIPALFEDRWFGYVGSLHPWQGVYVAVEAFTMAAPDLPGVRMLIVHNGRKAPLKLLSRFVRKQGLTDRILLQPPLPPEALAATMAKLHFTLAPLTETARNTLQGCCPVKIVESMAAGTPVLASDLRVCRDLITNGKDGWLVAPDDPRSWSLAIRDIFNDKKRLTHVRKYTRTKAEATFHWKKIHRELKRCFDSASGRGQVLTPFAEERMSAASRY